MGDDEKTRDPHRDLSGVLHDVSNALTVLLGWIGETRSPDATPETTAYALQIIEQRARIVRDLARHAIGAARIDEQKPAGEIAREVADALKVMKRPRSARRSRCRGADVSTKLSGAIDISQILTNLVMNALAYAPKRHRGGRRGHRPSRRHALHDDGRRPRSGRAGVEPRDDLHRRVAPSGRHGRRPPPFARPRTGVGRRSGALARHRRAGASFKVTWPRVDVVPRPPTSNARGRGLSGVKVLLVEDDIAVTQLLETALEGRGADVTIAATAAELGPAMKEGPFHAALVDLSPIAADPSAAIATLRKESPGIELVLITGSADALPEAVATENMKLVRKPFELGEVLAVLSALTKKP